MSNQGNNIITNQLVNVGNRGRDMYVRYLMFSLFVAALP